MTGDPVLLLSHRVKETLRGPLHVFLSADRQRYSTTNGFIASLCKSAVQQQRPICLWSSAGWYDRLLTHAAWPEAEKTA